MAVAKSKSLTAAARSLGISQPALTASTRKLEAVLVFEGVEMGWGREG